MHIVLTRPRAVVRTSCNNAYGLRVGLLRPSAGGLATTKGWNWLSCCKRRRPPPPLGSQVDLGRLSVASRVCSGRYGRRRPGRPLCGCLLCWPEGLCVPASFPPLEDRHKIPDHPWKTDGCTVDVADRQTRVAAKRTTRGRTQLRLRDRLGILKANKNFKVSRILRLPPSPPPP